MSTSTADSSLARPVARPETMRWNSQRPALDPAMSISLHFGRHWRRASEAKRSATNLL
jgi:hypothetical protein